MNGPRHVCTLGPGDHCLSLDDHESIVLVVHGVHGPIDHYGISNSAWKKMSLLEKYGNARSVTISCPTISVYRHVVGEFIERTFHVSSCSAHYFAGHLHALELVKCDHIYCTLSSAIWLRDYVDTKLAHVDLAGTIELHLANTGLPPSLSSEDFKANVLRLCGEMQQLLSRDRVFEAETEQVSAEGQMFSAREPVRGLLNRFSNPLASVANLADSITEAGLVEKSKAAFDRLEGDYNNLISFFENFLEQHAPDMVTSIVDGAVLFADFAYAFCYSNVYMLCSCIVRMCSTCGILRVVADQLISFVKGMLRLSPSQVREDANVVLVNARIEGASGIDHKAVLVALIGTFVTKMMPSLADIKKVGDTLRTFNAMTSAMGNLSSITALLPDLLPAVVKGWWEYLCPPEAWVAIVQGRFKVWMEECDSFMVESRKVTLRSNKQEQATLKRLIDTCSEFLNAGVEHAEIPRCMQSILLNYKTRLAKFDDVVQSTMGYSDFRRAPFCVQVYGTTELGKSFIMRALAAALIPRERWRENLVYPRTCATEYYDGFADEPVLMLDDFSQCRGVEVRDVKELIQLNNNAPYILPMASVDNPIVGMKGMRFTSELVLLSSNTGFPDTSLQIINASAMWRRRHVLWKVAPSDVVVANGWLTDYGAIDFKRVPREIKEDFLHLKWQQVDPCPAGNIGREVTIGSWMSTEEACMIMMRCKKEHEEDQIAAEKSIRANSWALKMQAAATRDGLFAMAQEYPETIVARMEMNRFEVAKGCVAKVLAAPSAVFVGAGSVLEKYYPVTDDVQDMQRKTWLREILTAVNKRRVEWQEKNPREYRVLKALATWGGLLAGSYALYRVFAGGGGTASPQDLLRQEILGVSALMSAGSQYGVGTTVRRPVFPKYVAQSACDSANLTFAMQYDPQGMDLIREHLATSMVYLECYLDKDHVDGLKNRLSGVAIGFDFILVPRHFFQDGEGEIIPSGTLIRLWTVQRVISETYFDPNSLHILKNNNGVDKDLVVYKFGPCLSNKKNRIAAFVSENKLGDVVGKPGVLVSYKDACLRMDSVARIGDSSISLGVDAVTGKQRTKAQEVNYSFPDASYEIKLVKGWEYPALTGLGDCGSILCFFDKSTAQKIAGIHVASAPTSGKGYAEIVTREQLQEVVDKYHFKVSDAPNPSDAVEEVVSVKANMDGAANWEVRGILPPRQCLRMPDKTAIIPSLLFDVVFPHVKEPAVLHPQDPRMDQVRSIIVNAVSKYRQQCAPFKEDQMCEVSESIENLLRGSGLQEIRVLLEVEAINGIPFMEFFDAMNMKSSCGWPMKLKLLAHQTKRVLFGGEPPKLFVGDPELRARLDVRENCAKSGKRVCSLWWDCPKDEKRSLAKITSGNTRAFAVAPVDFVILARKYMLAFSARLMQIRKNIFSAIGTNCDSLEWSDMVSHLERNSDLGFAGDFSNFDGSLSAQCMSHVCTIINNLYNDSDENKMVRTVLFDEIIHTVHLCMDVVYVVSGGNPSGNPLTAPLNTIVNEMYLRYAWLNLAPKEFASMEFYPKFVATKLYGDDNWVSVKREALPFYNMVTVAKFFSTLGFTFLPPSKKVEDMAPFAPIRSFMFLKRTCVMVSQISNTRPLGALEKETIQEMINWIRKDGDDYDMTADNCRTALRYAFSHGKPYFEDLRERIRCGFVRVGRPVPNLPTWRYLYTVFKECQGFPPGIIQQSGGKQCTVS